MPTAEEQSVLDAVNQIRASRGLRPFAYDPNLYVAATEHSREQYRHGYMGHGSPDPARRTLVQRMQQAGYDGMAFGEVVAWGYKTPQAVVEGWMNSRDHRAILVDRDMTQAAFSRVGDYWTGNFGTPMPRAARPWPVPPSTPQARSYPAPAAPLPNAPGGSWTPAARAPVVPAAPSSWQAPSAPSPPASAPAPTPRVQEYFRAPAAPTQPPVMRPPARGG